MADPSTPVGKWPVLANCDGHDTNINNLEFSLALREKLIYATCPPSNTTSATQQCDQPKANGGPIAFQKTCFMDKLMKHLRWKQAEHGKCSISMSEVAGEINLTTYTSYACVCSLVTLPKFQFHTSLTSCQATCSKCCKSIHHNIKWWNCTILKH